jgi:hypothetical protein
VAEGKAQAAGEEKKAVMSQPLGTSISASRRDGSALAKAVEYRRGFGRTLREGEALMIQNQKHEFRLLVRHLRDPDVRAECECCQGPIRTRERLVPAGQTEPLPEK